MRGSRSRKGPVDLLKACALLRQSTPDVRLVVVGGGETLFDYRARFDARTAELGVEPAVLGQVQHDELPPVPKEQKFRFQILQ